MTIPHQLGPAPLIPPAPDRRQLTTNVAFRISFKVATLPASSRRELAVRAAATHTERPRRASHSLLGGLSPHDCARTPRDHTRLHAPRTTGPSLLGGPFVMGGEGARLRNAFMMPLIAQIRRCASFPLTSQ